MEAVERRSLGGGGVRRVCLLEEDVVEDAGELVHPLPVRDARGVEGAEDAAEGRAVGHGRWAWGVGLMTRLLIELFCLTDVLFNQTLHKNNQLV